LTADRTDRNRYFRIDRSLARAAFAIDRQRAALDCEPRAFGKRAVRCRLPCELQRRGNDAREHADAKTNLGYAADAFERGTMLDLLDDRHRN